jgi:RNA polymerase sigma-70 factor (ECF subfamily)
VTEDLTEQFEGYRDHLHAVAYRMLGSPVEADDAVQEAWLRLQRADPSAIDNLGGWLTTVVGRLCLDQLRARKPLDSRVPPEATQPDPEEEALHVDAVGQALLVILDRLAPAERLAFVLHDLFDVPFDRIAGMLDRSPAAARQLASRARRRLQKPVPANGAGARQHAAVSAFLAAARDGDFEALLDLLDPDVVVRAGTVTVTGRDAVAEQAVLFARRSQYAIIMPIRGMPGIVIAPRGQVVTALVFTVSGARIRSMDVLEGGESASRRTQTARAAARPPRARWSAGGLSG